MTAKAHFAGRALTLEGRLVRQICAWCGHQLIDTDLEADAHNYPTWTEGHWIEVDQDERITSSLGELDYIPDHACMAAQLGPLLRLVQ